MVKLGTIRKTSERLNFKTWLKNHGRDGQFPVRLLFPPKDFPSFAIIFEDKREDITYDVKLTVRSEIFKEAIKALGITLKKNDLPTLYVIIQGNEYGLVIGDDVDHVLAWRGSYWFRVNVAQKDDLDITF
jgi:hypothetical protein